MKSKINLLKALTILSLFIFFSACQENNGGYKFDTKKLIIYDNHGKENINFVNMCLQMYNKADTCFMIDNSKSKNNGAFDFKTNFYDQTGMRLDSIFNLAKKVTIWLAVNDGGYYQNSWNNDTLRSEIINIDQRME